MDILFKTINEKLLKRQIDQLIIRVGKLCNFKCLFCNIGDNEKDIKDKFTNLELIREFYKQLQKGNLKNKEVIISISGGEPTLFKDNVLFIVAFISKYFEKKGVKVYFELQTNATGITEDFIKAFKKLGLTHVLISFHSNDSEVYKELIGVEYERFISKISEGINIVHDNDIGITFNTIFNKLNYKNVSDTLEFLVEKFPFVVDYNIGYFQPNGFGELNFDVLNLEIGELIPYYKNAIKYLEEKNKQILSHFTGLPVCHLGEYKKYSLEFNNNIELRKSSFGNKFFINNYNNKNKHFLKNCYSCVYNDLCSGVWQNFKNEIEIFPLSYKLISSIEDEKKNTYIFDEQVICRSSFSQLKSFVSESIIQGTPKITLWVDNDDFDIGSQLSLGFNNIQFYEDKNPNILNYILKNYTIFEENSINVDIFLERNPAPIEAQIMNTCNYIRFVNVGKNA